MNKVVPILIIDEDGIGNRILSIDANLSDDEIIEKIQKRLS